MGVGTAGAAVAVGGGCERIVGIEDLGNLFVQEVDKLGGVGGDVGDGFAAEFQRGVVAFGSSVLDEEQGGGYGLIGGLAHDVAVDEGLQVVVAVVLDVVGVEDGLDVGQVFLAKGTGLVVDDADTVAACLGIDDGVEAVDDACDGGDDGLGAVGGSDVALHADGFLETEDGEGRQAAVVLEQLTDIADDDLTVDELEAVERRHGP